MPLLRAVSASVVLLQHKAVFMICAVTKDSVQAHDPDSQEQGGFFFPLWYGDGCRCTVEREGWGRLL